MSAGVSTCRVLTRSATMSAKVSASTLASSACSLTLIKSSFRAILPNAAIGVSYPSRSQLPVYLARHTEPSHVLTPSAIPPKKARN